MPRHIRRLLIGYWACALGALIAYCVWPDLVATAPRMQGTVAITLYVVFLGVLMYLASASRAERLWLLAAFAVGGLAELIGVHTGWPFGRYEYTAIVVPQVNGWPPQLGLAWAEFAWYARYFTPTRWRAGRVLMGASWMTAIDIVMDPVASGPLQLWHWLEGGDFYGVPELNFKGWLLVAALIMACEPGSEPPEDEAELVRWKTARQVALSIGLSILLFFSVLALRHGLWIPAIVGGILLGTHLWIVRRPQA